MDLKIKHITKYRFDQPVDYALQKVKLRPASSVMQHVEAWAVDVKGGRIEASYIDHYGNLTDLVSADAGTVELEILVKGQVRTEDKAGIMGLVYGAAPLWHFKQMTALTEQGEGIAGLVSSAQDSGATLDGLHQLSKNVIAAVPYEIGKTNAESTAEDALKIGAGVCQDHAQIFIAAARELGFPARYISGYLMMDDRVDQDASHAWAEVHVEDLGWVGFDVSNGISPDERYVRIAIGRDAADAAPISGLRMGSSQEEMIVSLQVQQ